ncbi:MAG: hypothetical protein F4017_09640, partial [Acidimicrobiaceae bacterium]|nr:hypothetical protein [Acidimicrobiaceae bacterium]
MHTELSALQVVGRAELLIALGWPEDSLYRDPGVNSPDELEAALLLSTASGWMDPDKVLDQGSRRSVLGGEGHWHAQQAGEQGCGLVHYLAGGVDVGDAAVDLAQDHL